MSIFRTVALVAATAVAGVGLYLGFAPQHKPKQPPTYVPVEAPMLHPDDGFGRPHTLSGGF